MFNYFTLGWEDVCLFNCYPVCRWCHGVDKLQFAQSFSLTDISFLFFFLSIYPTALGLSCSLTDFPVIFIVARGIFSCGTRMISCSMWDLIRDQLPGSLYLEPWVLATGPPGESQQIFLSSLDSQPWWMIIVLSFPGWLFRSAGSQDWSCQCLRADSPPCLGYLESCLPSACCLSPAVKVLAAVGPPSSPRCSSHLLWT